MQDRRLKLSDGKIATLPNDWNDDQIAEFITAYEQPETPEARKPESALDRMKAGATMGLQATGQLEGVRALRNLVRRENWPMLAGGAGAMLGGIPGAALGGALGKAAQIQSGDTEPESVGAMMGDIATEGAIQGGLEGVGRGAGKLLSVAGNWGMRRALAPTAAMNNKYGDLAGMALDKRINVSKSGLGKVTNLKRAASGVKDAAIRNADSRAEILTEPIRRGATQDTMEVSLGERLLGETPGVGSTDVVTNFAPNRTALKPSELEIAKRRLDARTNLARNARRAGTGGESLADAERIALTNQAMQSLETVVPNIRSLNREIMDNKGLETAIKRRLGMPGTGLMDEGVIASAGTGMLGPMGMARVLREPKVLSALSILINDLAKGAKVTPNVARGLMLTSRDQ
jgi:hypothetical protein